MTRWAWAEVSAGAIEHNVRVVAATVAPAQVWAVVKANGYGHGSILAARAAQVGGAQGLCVALVQEGVVLREAGITGPILVLSEQPPASLPAAVHHQLALTVYSEAQLAALAACGAVEHPVHLKVDTGMRRVGAAPGDVLDLLRALRSGPLELEGVCTHCAVADEPGNGFTAVQLERFADVLDALDRHGIEVPVRHAANSAALLTQPGAAYDLVRPGIALYGVAPAAALAGAVDLRPALRWRSRVSHVKRVRAGEGISYGHHHRFATDSVVATVPVGYADGLPRRWGLRGGVVLIGGVRRPVVGVVTMDQVMVDCGPDGGGVGRGDEAVLIGAQGDERIAVEELAGALDTIAYEILTGVGRRAERVAV